MAKFIEIEVTSGTAHVAGKKLINVEDVSLGICSAANTIKLFLGTGAKQIDRGHLANSVEYTVKEINKREEGEIEVIASSKLLNDLYSKGMRAIKPTLINAPKISLSSCISRAVTNFQSK